MSDKLGPDEYRMDRSLFINAKPRQNVEDNPVPGANELRESCKENHKILWCVDLTSANTDRILYRGWMLELFLYSMVTKGGVNEEDICVTSYVTDLDNPYMPDYFNKIFSLFPRVKIAFDLDVGWNPIYKTMDNGPEEYCAINKSSALIAVYRNGYHAGYDMVALLDLDCFMYGKAAWDRYPTETTLTWYPSCEPKRAVSLTSGLTGLGEGSEGDPIDIWGNKYDGIDMTDIMRAIRVPEVNIQKIKAGSYNVFIAADDFTEELVYGFQYFTIALKALLAAAGHAHVWQAEMSAYPLAMASYGVDYDVSDDVEINDIPWHRTLIPEGTLLTYAFNNISSYGGSIWNKLNYMESTPFSDKWTIDKGLELATSDAERTFYEYLREIWVGHLIERKI